MTRMMINADKRLYTVQWAPSGKRYYAIIDGEPDFEHPHKRARDAVAAAKDFIVERNRQIEEAIAENLEIEKLNFGDVDEDEVDNYFPGAPE